MPVDLAVLDEAVSVLVVLDPHAPAVRASASAAVAQRTNRLHMWDPFSVDPTTLERPMGFGTYGGLNLEAPLEG